MFLKMKKNQGRDRFISGKDKLFNEFGLESSIKTVRERGVGILNRWLFKKLKQRFYTGYNTR